MNIRTHSLPESTYVSPTQSRRAWLVRLGLPLAVISLGSIVLSGCSRGELKAHAGATPVVRVVEIDTARHGKIGTMNYTGVVRARTESSLGFRVAGKIAERLVNAGDAVKKDQPLLKLDPVDYQLALQAARADVEAAQAMHTQASLEQERVRILVEKRAESRDAMEGSRGSRVAL